MGDWGKVGEFWSGNLHVKVLSERDQEYSSEVLMERDKQAKKAVMLRTGAHELVAEDWAERSKKYTDPLVPKLRQVVAMAQAVMSSTRDILAQDTGFTDLGPVSSGGYNRLSPEEWKRYRWAACRLLKCINLAPGARRRSPFPAGRLVVLKDKLTRIENGLNSGTLVIKVGFPGIVGRICEAYMDRNGMVLEGLVQVHPFQNLLKSDRGTSAPFLAKWKAVQGDIHLARKSVMTDDLEDVTHIFLHEAGHKFAALDDVMYYSNKETMTGCRELDADQSFKNADSYALFCMVIAGEMEAWLNHGQWVGGYGTF